MSIFGILRVGLKKEKIEADIEVVKLEECKPGKDEIK